MSLKRSLVVVGSCNIDLVARTPRLPLRGETITGTSFATFLGGKGLNQTVAARRMGAPVAMIARIGSDDFGARVRATLSDEGIDHTYVVRDEQPTGTALIQVEDGTGENTIVIVPGANGALTPADVDRAAPTIQHARVLLLQLEVPLATTLHAATIAQAAGVLVVLTPAPAQPLPDQLLVAVDVLLPNAVELQQLLEHDVTPAEGAQALLDRGCKAVVVTLGSRGALLATPQGQQPIAAFNVTPVDTVGAGDAFAGALGARLAAGDDLATAARWASAAGALAVTQAGAIPSLPMRAAVQQLIAAGGI